MRDTFARLVEATHALGYDDDTSFEWMFVAVMASFTIEDYDGMIRFAPEGLFPCVFHVLEDEGLIERLPTAGDNPMLGTETYQLTPAGVRLSFQASELVAQNSRQS
mgnify:CR=1 FL=1